MYDSRCATCSTSAPARLSIGTTSTQAFRAAVKFDLAQVPPGANVTGAQVQQYMSAQTGLDLSKVFAQYLTTTKLPTLEYRADGATLAYRWADVVPGFDMPVRALPAASRRSAASTSIPLSICSTGGSSTYSSKRRKQCRARVSPALSSLAGISASLSASSQR